MFVKVEKDCKIPKAIIIELGEIQEGDKDDIEKELKIEFTEDSAIFYVDNTLIGSFDIEHIWTFKGVLTRVLDIFEKLEEI